MALALYFAVLAAIFCFMEIATFPFMAEFDTRPDRLFIEHMLQVREVFGMILKGYAANLAAGIAGMALAGSAVFLLTRKYFCAAQRPARSENGCCCLS